ncbi:hypothetical protein AALP_AA1G135000 [Arabis alpina]|uniref:F-box domain-containing protein n=1 Tax=Arabis alpina TaxID=50452 RepID=A0A087HN09_ARAAL|nr:hypothetical protein AALP_AA1G135000 [Arabis alpina]
MYFDKPGLGKISELSEDLLVKILSFLPTKEAVSTSILSKQWQFLWRWLPKLEYDIDDFESEFAFGEYMNKNLPLHRAPVLKSFSLSPLLQRLSLNIPYESSSRRHVIVTPSLKYFKLSDEGVGFSYLVEHMPNLEEADISADDRVEKLLESITSVKRLSLSIYFYNGQESLYPAGLVFNQLEHLKLGIGNRDWQQLLFHLLEHSPKLRDLYIFSDVEQCGIAPFSWNNISVPKCLLESLESFKFEGYQRTPEEGEFLSFFFRNASRLKSSSISE